ncbi:hypothetical protein EV383_4615 [Pseudonocardia sediminis]|uniref:SnoaL-like domain-containing protein n=1 Tax=Pseudonocardia sediminis TaxID=1397368 RepID=A0A4Q7V4Y8_PSEST|nr:nuclear transport factor 2 family protein [Pseudonocardia sediminis]RZT87689.1 hypothetical protein EV383_4615 [Pseudonocardia sediminis]
MSTTGSDISSGPISVARDAYDAFARGDVPALLAMLDPDVVWRAPEGVPWGGEHRGTDQVREFFAALAGAVDEAAIDLARILPAGTDRVLVEGVERYRIGPTRVDLPFAHVARWRAGLITEFTDYTNVLELRRALDAHGRA